MWIIFSVIFTIAALGLEIIEGYKITTTAYYGLKNAGVAIIIFNFIFCMFIYPISFLLLTYIVNRYIKHYLIIKSIVYTIAGGLSGIWAFNKIYGYAEGSFIKGYNLNINTSIVLFSIAGLLYFLMDYKINKE